VGTIRRVGGRFLWKEEPASVAESRLGAQNGEQDAGVLVPPGYQRQKPVRRRSWVSAERDRRDPADDKQRPRSSVHGQGIFERLRASTLTRAATRL